MHIKNHRFNDNRVEHFSSPNVGKTIEPSLIVLHYTASGGENGEGDASYLSRASSRVSAHIVVGRDGGIYQLVPFNKASWHAGRSSYDGRSGVNNFSIGIEIDNWGWLGNDRKSHAGVRVPDEFVFEGERNGLFLWEAYREEQLASVEQVIAAICKEYNIKDIVGHEDVSPGRKQDPGPALDEFKQRMKDKYLKNEERTKSSEQSKVQTKERTHKTRTTTANLNLRQSPRLYAKILTVIPKGSKVELLSEWNGWSEVRYGSRQAFVSSSYLT